MLLRRITKHIKDQNWLAVLVDFLIVVVGVFIGIQVANWNTERINEQLEEQYLLRLFDDMNGTIEDYLENNIWDIRIINAQYSILEQLKSGVQNQDETSQFELGLAWAGKYNPPRRRWGTVEELVSTGNITLINDVALRNDISKLSAWFDRNKDIVKDSETRLIPLRAQLVKNYRIDRFDTINFKPLAKVEYDFETLAGDDEFINVFSSLHLESVMMVVFNRYSMSQCEQFRNKLAEILGLSIEGLPKISEDFEQPWVIDTTDKQ